VRYPPFAGCRESPGEEVAHRQRSPLRGWGAAVCADRRGLVLDLRERERTPSKRNRLAVVVQEAAADVGDVGDPPPPP